MIQTTGRITINRSIDDMFDFVADATNEPLYNPMILVAEKVTDGPVGLNTRFRDEARSAGRTREALIEIIGYEPPHRLVEANRMPGTDILGTLRFDEVP